MPLTTLLRARSTTRKNLSHTRKRTLDVEAEVHDVAVVHDVVFAFDAELAAYVHWYNTARPHQALRGATPAECLVGCSLARTDRRIEPRERYPLPKTGPPARRLKGKLKLVISYQGDGDLAAIGTAETIHAANRGENFLVVFINNGIYGMTSGQMAPTTLPGMVTTTSPYGRDVKTMGYPLKIADLLALLPGVVYVTRQAVHTVANVRKAKKAMKNAFEYQKKGLGFCLIEIVTNCPSNWKMEPLESIKFVADKMIPYYPLGDIKKPEGK